MDTFSTSQTFAEGSNPQSRERSADLSIRLSKAQFLSPFRFPGGKTWFMSHIRTWLSSRLKKPAEFIEPFAGGASIGLMVAREELADHVTLVEIDSDIASVWKVVINGEDDALLLAQRIRDFQMSEEAVESELSNHSGTLNDLAFQTILRNRISRGGILAPGAGRLKKGEDGRGLASRWYPETLFRRISHIVALRESITFVCGDGLQMIEKCAACEDNVFFIDPPYTASSNGAGTRLYTHYTLDHEALFERVSNVKGDFLMTYDSHPDVRALASRYEFDLEEIEMRNTHHSRRTELLIGKDLSWIRHSSKADGRQVAI